METAKQRRDAARRAKFGDNDFGSGIFENEPKLKLPKQPKPIQAVKKETVVQPLAEKSQGEGVRNRLSESGVRIGSEQRMLARAVNWQQKNRFPLELAVVGDKLVEATGDQPQIYEEILVNAVMLMRSNKPRAKANGVRAGVQLAKLVQSDDHAKLKAELRPTQLMPQVVIDQSTHNDNRRVIVTIPDNGRDPEIYSQRPDSDSKTVATD